MLKSVRRDQILKNGLEMVRESGFETITLLAVAARCDCSMNTVKAYFKNRGLLSREIVKYAQEVGDETTVKTGKRLFPD